MAIAHVQVDTWRTAYKGIVPDNFLDRMSYEGAQRNWQWLIDPVSAAAVYVAEDDSRVVGFAAGGVEKGKDPYKAQLYAIYVLEEFQRKGIGLKLTLPIVQDMKSSGLTSMTAWVLEESPSKQFFEEIGGARTGSKEKIIGSKSLQEVCYVWKNLGALVERLGRGQGSAS